MIDDRKSAARTEEGRFSKGRSGNPAGRPKGARNRATLVAEAFTGALDDDDARVMARLWIDKALAGDKVALRFFAERLWPKPKGRPIELDLAPGEELDPQALVRAG